MTFSEQLLALSLHLKHKTSDFFSSISLIQYKTDEESMNRAISECFPDEFSPYDYQREVQAILNSCRENEINPVPFYDCSYPELLKHVYDPPVILYAKGCISPLHCPVAIVGARKCSTYGKKVSYALGRGLAEKKCSVISGLAYGIDASAHLGALDAPGKTVAVLGCGVEAAYPKRNKNIYERILRENGAVISEFPPGTEIRKHHFPLRNRIISGISKGVVIVEAAERSGALITTKYALEEGREVFSVPGPITSPVSIGTNRLIRISGAKLVTSVDDILEEFSLTETGYFDRLQNTLPGKSCRILASIPFDEDAAVDVDQLSRTLEIPVREMMMKIIDYENQDLISRTRGNKLYRI